MKQFKPMLAANISKDLDKLRFPVFATPKLDGVRALITKDGVLSRSLKKIPHKITQGAFREPELVGLDGELIVGSPTATDVYRHTQSVLARAESPEPATLYVFDKYDSEEEYCGRLHEAVHLAREADNLYVCVLGALLCHDMDQLLAREEAWLNEGYEGLILRATDGAYKYGRSTIKEQGMLKLKRFVDSEALIVGMVEEMENRNVATINELGLTERSSHKANLVGKGRMGVLIGRDKINGKEVEFEIGTGFTVKDKEDLWRLREQIENKAYAKYKYFPIGMKDKPRHAGFQGLREGWDT